MSAWAANYVIGLSPNYGQKDRPEILKHLLLFVLEGASSGDQLTFYDALNLQPVATCNLGQERMFQRNARARAQRFKSELAALLQFMSAERAYAPEMTGVIDLPRFLRLAGSQLRKPGDALKVIVIGSPFYMSTNDPSWNMNSAYPSDGTLSGDAESVFARSNRSSLKGLTLHFAYLRQCFLNQFHQDRIARFWALYVQDGVLATFAPSIDLALQRAKDDIEQPCVEATVNASDLKVEMRDAAQRGIPVWFGRTNLIEQLLRTPSGSVVSGSSASFGSVPLFSSRLARQPATILDSAVLALREKVGIGIMWAAPVDCDLYVRASPSAQELCYTMKATKEGKYFLDYRSGNIGADYEMVELQPPIDLKQVECWINYFSGSVSPVRGIVVLSFEGRSFYGQFELNAQRGNAGIDKSTRENSSCWARIDLAQLIAFGAHFP